MAFVYCPTGKCIQYLLAYTADLRVYKTNPLSVLEIFLYINFA